MNKKKGILGIDAGGTFTDLAFLGKEDLRVVARVKVPTRHDDLPSTIEEGISLILREIDGGWIEDVHLASTLATNATVENRMAAAGLLLIGYDEGDVSAAVRAGRFGDVLVESVPGGHDIKGNESMSLDERRLLRACESLLDRGVSGIAVSGYFSVRNPSHEIRARELILERFPGLSVTCGHELASDLDAFKRATTASVNAGLIPILMRLLEAVKGVLKKRGIKAPLSVIKGDGALVSDEWAARHPVETVVSGPAASAMGARLLAGGKRNGRASWIVDIGGTTTDIIGLDKFGNPLLKGDGADIGGHRILVKTIDIRTFGLGGDSRVTRLKDGELQIGPRRVIPLAVASETDARVLSLVEEMLHGRRHHHEPVIFMPGSEKNAANPFEEGLIAKLASGPATLETLSEGKSLGTAHAIVQNLERYEERGIFSLSSFTPTDALLALGRLDKWPSEASIAGARIFALMAGYADYAVFCEEVCERVSSLASGEVFRKAMESSKRLPGGKLDDDLLKVALRSVQPEDIPAIGLKLNADLIGVGAPAWAFVDISARMLGETAILPEDASVAGAIGAAAGTFFMHHSILITPLKSGEFRVHLPSGIADFEELEAAVERSVAFMEPWLERLAREAGSMKAGISWERQDEIARISGGTQEVLLWSRILFTVREEEEQL